MSNKDLKYLDRLFTVHRRKKIRHSNQLINTISTGFFQSAKDYSEVYGTVKALQRYVGKNGLSHAFRSACNIYVIGDGADPQCGYMLARLFTRSTVYSIDPRLRSQYISDAPNWRKSKLAPNQIIIKLRVEDFVIPTNHVELSIIVGVHNHGPIQGLHEELLNYSDRIVTVSLPCCTTDANLSEEPTQTIDDNLILSPKRTIYIWDISSKRNETSIE